MRAQVGTGQRAPVQHFGTIFKPSSRKLPNRPRWNVALFWGVTMLGAPSVIIPNRGAYPDHNAGNAMGVDNSFKTFERPLYKINIIQNTKKNANSIMCNFIIRIQWWVFIVSLVSGVVMGCLLNSGTRVKTVRGLRVCPG